MEAKRLSKTVAVITGGGSGLGRALVERFADEGAQVAVLERSPDKAAELAALMPGIEVITGDATSAPDVERTVKRTIERFGGIDTFVANAGLWDFGVPADQLEPTSLDQSFEEIFAVNVKAVLLGAIHAYPELARRRGNVIVSLSGAYDFPGGGGALYVASKHAAHGLVRQLAYEWAPEVRVNGVAPGVMHSDLRGISALGQEQSVIEDVLPKGGLGERTITDHDVTPADYCSPYVMLAARQETPTTTGIVIDLTGTGVRGRRDRERVRELAKTHLEKDCSD